MYLFTVIIYDVYGCDTSEICFKHLWQPQKQQYEDTLDNNIGLQSDIKKTRHFSPNVQEEHPNVEAEHSSSLATSVPENNVGNMIMKTERGEDDNYQDYTEAEMDDTFDESALQDHDESGTDKVPIDSKGMFTFSISEQIFCSPCRYIIKRCY